MHAATPPAMTRTHQLRQADARKRRKASERLSVPAFQHDGEAHGSRAREIGWEWREERQMTARGLLEAQAARVLDPPFDDPVASLASSAREAHAVAQPQSGDRRGRAAASERDQRRVCCLLLSWKGGARHMASSLRQRSRFESFEDGGIERETGDRQPGDEFASSRRRSGRRRRDRRERCRAGSGQAGVDLARQRSGEENPAPEADGCQGRGNPVTEHPAVGFIVSDRPAPGPPLKSGEPGAGVLIRPQRAWRPRIRPPATSARPSRARRGKTDAVVGRVVSVGAGGAGAGS